MFVPTLANQRRVEIARLAQPLFVEQRLGLGVDTLNDADAAGLAEMRYGAGRDRGGVVLMLTFGTGIGSALIYRGVLVPNTELGHLEIDGKDAETQAAASVKTALGLSYDEYVPRLQRYYERVEALFWPDLFVVGGGVSKAADKFLPQLKLKTPIVAAHLRNRAGIIGAAWLAVDKAEHPDRAS